MRIYLVFFIKPKRFARSRHGYISKHDETRVNLILFSLIQCIQCLKKGNEENEKYLQPSPPATLSFIIVIPSPITGKEEGRHAGGRRRRIRNIWVSEPPLPPSLPPRISNFSVKEHRILSEATRVVTLCDGMKTGPRNDPISAGALFVERRRITLCKSGEI